MKIQNSKSIFLSILFILIALNFATAQNKKTTIDSTWYQTQDCTKHIYWPTAYGLKEGEHYYQNIFLFWQQLQLGVTDNFSLGVGMELFSLLTGIGSPVLSLSPKYTEPLNDKLHVGVGVWSMFTINFDNAEGVGVVYGLISHGDESNNVTVGVGHGNYFGKWSSIPQINLGFNARIAKRGGISGEFWFLQADQDEAFSFMALSLKYIGRKVTFDIGLFSTPNFEFIFPMATMIIPFDKKR